MELRLSTVRRRLERRAHRLRMSLRPSSAPQDEPDTPRTIESVSGEPRFINPTINDVDVQSNLEFNRQRWGQAAGLTEIDRFGYRWGVRGIEQTVGGVSAFADKYFRPFTHDNYKFDITELSPGGGRFTAELIRYARSMTLVDM